ncbi:TPA: tetronasin resistance protein, partial [Streptococcus agalactiae]
LGKIVYIYLTFSFLLNYFSGLIDLPEWFLNTAIQSWMPQMPMDDFEASVFLTVTIISIALIVIGFLGYSRRDMNEGA